MGNFTTLILLATGCFVGVTGAVFGIGGGFIIIPVLVFYCGLPMHDAIAVSLTSIIATSAVVSMRKAREGLINIRLGTALDLATALGAAAGAMAAARMSQSTLKMLFSFLVAAAALMMFRRGFKSLYGKPAEAIPVEPPARDGRFCGEFRDATLPGGICRYGVRNFHAAAAGSLAAGAVSGLLGIGGGIITVPLTNLVCRMPLKAAAATSNFMLGVTAGTSVMIYCRDGGLQPHFAAPIVLGVMFGAGFGMKILMRSREDYLQIAFGLLLSLVAVKMYVSSG